MKRELQEQIFKECPLLYGDRTKPMTQTCMCWGIDVAGNGWFNLIRDLSIKLEKLIVEYLDKNPSLPCQNCWDSPAKHIPGGCGAAHSNIYVNDGKPVKCTCKGYEASYPCASQVKDKYRGLRFYMTSATKEMWDLIEKAETDSYSICDVCGAENAEGYSDNGWDVTRCKEHAFGRNGEKLELLSVWSDEEDEEC